MPKIAFDEAIQTHDALQAAARLRAGDPLNEVAQTIYNRARHRPAALDKPGYPLSYTVEIMDAAYGSLDDRPDLQTNHTPAAVRDALFGHIRRPEYDLDTNNRVWVLEQLHEEVKRFQKNPGHDSSLRGFLQQTESYIFDHPDRSLLSDSSTVNYVLSSYAEAAIAAMDGDQKSQAFRNLEHFTSGPYSVEKALKYPDPVAYLHDWTATDLGIQHAMATPDLNVAIFRWLANAPGDKPISEVDAQGYGGLTTDHPLLRKIIADHEPDFPTHQRDLSLAVNCLEKGYSNKEVIDFLQLQRTDLKLTDTAGKNPFAQFMGGLRNAVIKAAGGTHDAVYDFGLHQEYVVEQATNLRAAFHRALAIDRTDNPQIQNAGEPTYHGLETDHPMVRQLILAHAGNDPELQRALSLAINGVEQGHTEQRIFRDLNTERSASRAPNTLAAPEPLHSSGDALPRTPSAPLTERQTPIRENTPLRVAAPGPRVSQPIEITRDSPPITHAASRIVTQQPPAVSPQPAPQPETQVAEQPPRQSTEAHQAASSTAVPSPKSQASQQPNGTTPTVNSAPSPEKNTPNSATPGRPQPSPLPSARTPRGSQPSQTPTAAPTLPQPSPTPVITVHRVPAAPAPPTGPTHPITPAQQMLAKSDTPRTVATPHAIKPVPSNKDILNMAKEIHAKFQQQVRLQHILATPLEFAQRPVQQASPERSATPAGARTPEKEIDVQRQPAQQDVERNRPRFRSRGHSR